MTVQIDKDEFIASVKHTAENFQDFNSRTGVKDFWYFAAAAFVVNIIASILFSVLGGLGDFLSLLISLALLVPSLAVGARRLHDINMSGWWQLLSFTVIGIVVLIYWWIQPSDPTENDYGKPPVIDVTETEDSAI